MIRLLTVAELLDEATEEDLQRIANSIKLRDGEELTEELIQDIVTPHYIGPTWATNDDGSWYLPEHTLGWKIAGWCAEYLLNPQDDTKPWKFTPEQLRFILWWYAIDEKGKFLYQSGVLQRRKGWGKDPLLAVICLVEFVGPCRFVGWDTEGNVLTRPEKASLVLVSAVTKEQTSNTADMFPLLMSKKFIATYKVTPGIELIRAQGGTKKIMLLTGSYRAAEGKRSTFTLMNETHHWVAGNGGPKMYEALALNTPIPTPDGIKMIGDLVDGDVIFGSSGRQVTVSKAHDVQIGRDAYRVTTANGDSLVASDGHLWTAAPLTGPGRRKLSTWTTRQMVEDGRKFSIPRAGIFQSEPPDLPLDPYILGAWLGDGSTGKAQIAIGESDVAEMGHELTSRGLTLRPIRVPVGSCPVFTFTNRSRGSARESMGSEAARALRSLDCYTSKHIPEAYFAAGTEQRIELLRGLMDTDGCFTNNLCVFITASERLARDVARLASSLGLLPYVNHYGEVWRVHFVAEEFVPFSMPRKARLVTPRKRRERVSITIEKVESVPVRCISVDAEDELFVAANGMVTHNTIDGNTAKNPSSRYLAITNAYLPGEESVAESMRSDYESFKALGYSGGFLYDSVEAKARAPIGGPLLPLVLEQMLGDSVWDTVETHIASMIRSIMKRSISPARSRRMWLNQVVADEDALYSPEDWDTNLDEDAILSPGDEIILGLDGGKTDDSTVLMAIKPSTMEAFVLGMWEKPTDVKDETWIVDQSLVDEVVEMAHNRYEVIGFLSDVSGWETWIVRWEEKYASNYRVRASEARAIGYDMRSNLKEITHSNEALFKSITDGELRHDGDFRLRRHVLNARRRNNKWGVSFGKENRESDRKVDAYAALLLAYIGTVKYRIKPKKPEKKKGSRSFFM